MDRRDLIGGLIGALDPVFKIVCPIIDPTLRPVLDIVHGLLGVDVCGPKGASVLSAESLVAPLAALSVEQMALLESALKTITEQALKQAPVSPPSTPLTPRADKVPTLVKGGEDGPVPDDEVCEDDGPCSDDEDLDAEAAPAPVDKVPTEKLPVDPKPKKPSPDSKHPHPPTPNDDKAPTPDDGKAPAPEDGKAPAPAAAAPSPPAPSPPAESPAPPSPPKEKPNAKEKPDSKEKVPAQKSEAPIPPPMRRSKASLGWSYHRREPSESRILENAPPLFSNVPVATRPDFAP